MRHTPLRRSAPLTRSAGTRWPAEVREHVREHQPRCIGPLTDPPMPDECWPPDEMDHVRASGGIQMKSESIATNAARVCHRHHEMKTHDGRTWRPRFLAVIARLHGECARCQREAIEVWGTPIGEGVES